MRDIILNLQIYDRWTIQLTIVINFISSKDVDEERVMHSKSDSKDFMPYDNVNEDDKCFQYAGTVALNYEKIKRDPQRVTKVKPFMNKYNWNGMKYASEIDVWKTFEKNNPTIGLNALYIKEKEIYFTYISNLEKQNILLKIPNGDKKNMVSPCSKKIICIVIWNNFKNKGNFCLNCFYSFRTKNKLKSYEKVYKNKDFCGNVMPSERDNMLEFNQ